MRSHTNGKPTPGRRKPTANRVNPLALQSAQQHADQALSGE
jgi:hypothetical protein